MSGPAVPPRLPWRQRARRLLSSKPSSPQGRTPTLSTIQPVSSTPSSNAALTTAVAAVPDGGVNVPDSSTAASTQLLQDALQFLNDGERSILKKHISLTSSDVRSAVDDAVDAARSQRQVCLDNRWSVSIGGRDVVLREKADKVIHWLDRFKTVGDVAANADPVHVGLPWAGIRLLLEVAIAESNQMAALLVGCETALYMASRLRVYIEFWHGLPVEVPRGNLEGSIVTMYAHILRFLSQAICAYEASALRRIFSALWHVDDTIEFERKGNRLATKVEIDASNCDRSVSAHTQERIEELQQTMQDVLAGLQQYHQLQASLDHLHIKIDLGTIPYAQGAIFDSSDSVHTLCHPGTRRDILSQVQTWAQQPDGKSIFWLYGGAGTGKSTISWTAAKWLTNMTDAGSIGVDLGASFFFKRGEGDRGSANRFSSTIIRQLVTKIPGLDVLVANAIESDPFIFDKALAEQFRRLILHPLQGLRISHVHQSALIVVVDALDECEREPDVECILELWSQLSHLTTVRLRLFLTSRYEPSIWPVFQQMSVDMFEDIDLVDAVPLNSIEHDLSIYLHDSLSSIRTKYNQRLRGIAVLTSDWPDSDKVRRLVVMAAPLFIVATTICLYIGDVKFDPQERLERVLHQPSIGLSQMDLTYRPVLEHLTHRTIDTESQEEICRDFRIVVGSIVVLAEPLSLSSLVLLLKMSPQSVALQLAPLHSVLRIPTDCHAPIRTLHLSFIEFLLNDKARQHPYGIDGPGTHLALSIHCLRVLSTPGGLRENICALDQPGQLRHEIDSNTITMQLSPILQYACRHWVHHIQHSKIQIQDHDEVHVFLQKHFLHWLEALSLMGRLSEAISLVSDLQSCTSAAAIELPAFLEDARRFVLANRFVINLVPLQLYSSATIFVPKGSLVRTICGRVPSWVIQHPETRAGWGCELQRLEGHSDIVQSVAVSPDGSLIASGSWDCTIRLWDTYTGHEVQKLEGHSLSVLAVGFSPDASLTASVSEDCTIRVWDARTGHEVKQLTSHSKLVSTVAFSPDGSLLASGSGDCTIRLWDTRTWQEVQKLEGHSDFVWVVAFSPAGHLLASGSWDHTIRLWDTHTGHEVDKLDSHSNLILTVAFSPDGSLLAAGLSDFTVRLWDTRTWQEVRKLEGHSHFVWTVAFSPDGSLLASGSGDRTIQIWDVYTGFELQKLEGHSDLVLTVVFSSDGSRLISGSGDSTIRLWDTHTKHEVQRLECHSNTVRVVVFSPNGSLLASGSRDSTIRLWDSHTGRKLHTLGGHSGSVGVVVFSPDGSLLASGSSDGAIRLWDTRTGHEVYTLEGHTQPVRILAFSPDGSRLASKAEVHTIWLWDTQTGRKLQTLEGHSDLVEVVVFSPDGSLLASGSSDGTIRLRDIRTGHEMYTLEGHTQPVRILAFSPDVSGPAPRAEVHTIWLWDTQTGRKVRELPDLPILASFYFSDDNKSLVTDKGTINIDDGTVLNDIPVETTTIHSPIDISHNWIRMKKQNLLWLPHDYRGRWAVSGNRLAVGSESGLVSIFQFKI